MDAAREELIERIADVLIGTRYPATLFNDEAVRLVEGIVAGQVFDALLADGRRWMLVHPDEMIRRDELEQVGWTVEITFNGEHVEYESFQSAEMHDEPVYANSVPVFRVRPAVEKENDQ